MVEVKDSVEKPGKKAIRNKPRGFKDTEEQVLEQAKETVSQSVELSAKQKNEEIFNDDHNSTKDSKKHLMNKKHKNRLIVISVVAAVLLLVFVFRPNILGLGVYDEGEINDTLNNLAGASVSEEEEETYGINDLGDSIEELKFEISSRNEKLTEFLDNDINRITGDLVSCLTEKSSLEDVYEESIDSLEDKLDEKKQEVELLKAQVDDESSDIKQELVSLQNSFDALALSTAHSICCKKKVDNLDIDYYDIVNNKVVCLEEGNRSLSCFS